MFSLLFQYLYLAVILNLLTLAYTEETLILHWGLAFTIKSRILFNISSMLINQFVAPNFCLCFDFSGVNFRGMLHQVCDVAYDENIRGPIRTRKCRSTNWLINYMDRNGELLKSLRILVTTVYFKDQNWISKTLYCISCSMVCKITFYSEFPDILNKAGRVTRRRTQTIEKRLVFHANAINIK